jgi:hypothetical protein
MKKLTTSILACGILASGLLSAGAAAHLRVSPDGGTTWVTIDDNGPLDTDPTVGVVEFDGPIGNWSLNISSGQSEPFIGSPATPNMDLFTLNSSTQPATLIVQYCDSDLLTLPSETYINSLSYNTAGLVMQNAYRDAGNVVFGTTQTYPGGVAGTSPSPTALLLSTVGPVSGANSFSNGMQVLASGNFPNSLTIETIINHAGTGRTSTDAHLFALPQPPCNCTLTFSGPSSVTNCQGDSIPGVTASQDCGAGPVSVPVTLSSATTNGSCPSIITLVYSAKTDCGDVKTFTQTVTANCRGNICGHVFADCDGNGDLTAGDVGISNIIVSLLDSANHLLGKTTSDKNGGYCFTNLSGGNYVVTITPPSGYCQTAASTSYHWKDSYGRTCWQENDGYIHCLSSSYECWWDKSNTCHWKDTYNRDCWKDGWGYIHCQPLSYKSCNALTNNNCISVTLTNCTSQTDVDFAYTGTKPSVSVSCSGPSSVRCGQTYTYTCTVENTGNVCFKGGNVCTTVGNCTYWGGWNYGCNNYTANCPPLSPGQKCTITVKCSFNSWNCGTVACQSQVNCNHNYGTSSGQSWCYSQCSW